MELLFDSKEIQKNLQKLIEKQLPDAIEEGLKKACLIVTNEATKKCPVDDGQLRQSITFDVDKQNNIGYVGSNVEYAPYVEIGTGIYSTKGDGRQTPWVYCDAKGDFHTTEGMKAQPFLQPSVEENKDRIIGSFKGLI